MFQASDALGLLLPGVVAAVALALVGLRARAGAAPPGPAAAEATPPSAPWRGAAAGALVAGVAAFAGQVALFGWPAFPPPSLDPWVPWLTLLAAGAGAAEGALAGRGAPRWAAWSVRLAVAGFVAGVLLRPRLGAWSAGEAAGALVAAVGAGLALRAALDGLLARRGPLGGALLLLALAGPTAGALAGAGSLRYGQLAATLAAAAGGVAAAAALGLRAPGLALPGAARGAAATLAPALVALGLRGHFYFELVLPAALLLVAAPLAAWLAEPLRRPRPDGGRRRALAGELLGLVLVAAAASGAAALAASRVEAEADPYGAGAGPRY